MLGYLGVGHALGGEFGYPALLRRERLRLRDRLQALASEHQDTVLADETGCFPRFAGTEQVLSSNHDRSAQRGARAADACPS